MFKILLLIIGVVFVLLWVFTVSAEATCIIDHSSESVFSDFQFSEPRFCFKYFTVMIHR